MKKYIFKIIDMYFENKFIDFINKQVIVFYPTLDFKVEKEKNIIIIKAKKRENKYLLYSPICVFNRKHVLNYLMNQDYVKVHFTKLINYYLKNEVK